MHEGSWPGILCDVMVRAYLRSPFISQEARYVWIDAQMRVQVDTVGSVLFGVGVTPDISDFQG